MKKRINTKVLQRFINTQGPNARERLVKKAKVSRALVGRMLTSYPHCSTPEVIAKLTKATGIPENKLFLSEYPKAKSRAKKMLLRMTAKEAIAYHQRGF